MADLVIANAYVVTMNPGREIFADGAVAITGKRIAAVGPSAQVLAANPGGQVIDGRGMMAIPGLIDAHQHPNQYLSSGIGDDVDLMTWLFDRVYPYEAALTEEEAYLSAMGAYVESIKNGTTCINDPGGGSADALARAAVDVGIRGILSRSTQDLGSDEMPIPPRLIEDTETCLRNAEAHVARWNGAAEGRLRAWYSLRYPLNVTDALCRGVKALADRDGVGLHAHAAEAKGEHEAMEALFGKRALARYRDLGLFGPNLYLIHMGYTAEDEIAWLVEHDAKVCHCPSAAMLVGLGTIGLGMIPKMIAAGVTVSLGTDSATAGGHLDMVRLMYLAACAHKDTYADPTLIGAYKALEMATIDGARACLWKDGIGSIEAGKLADLTLVDTTGLEFHPAREPVRSLVYSCTGRDVDTVIIDGRVVMRNRVVLTVDEERLKHDIAAASVAWRKRAGVRASSHWPVQ